MRNKGGRWQQHRCDGGCWEFVGGNNNVVFIVVVLVSCKRLEFKWWWWMGFYDRWSWLWWIVVGCLWESEELTREEDVFWFTEKEDMTMNNRHILYFGVSNLSLKLLFSLFLSCFFTNERDLIGLRASLGGCPLVSPLRHMHKFIYIVIFRVTSQCKCHQSLKWLKEIKKMKHKIK